MHLFKEIYGILYTLVRSCMIFFQKESDGFVHDRQSARRLRHLFQPATTPCRGVELVDSGGHPHPHHILSRAVGKERSIVYTSSLISAVYSATLVFVN